MRLLVCDPDYLRNNSYVSFLLIVQSLFSVRCAADLPSSYDFRTAWDFFFFLAGTINGDGTRIGGGDNVTFCTALRASCSRLSITRFRSRFRCWARLKGANNFFGDPRPGDLERERKQSGAEVSTFAEIRSAISGKIGGFSDSIILLFFFGFIMIFLALMLAIIVLDMVMRSVRGSFLDAFVMAPKLETDSYS